MDNIVLIMLSLFVISVGLVIGVLNFLQLRKNKKIKKNLESLEIEKNKLATSPIVPELAKVEAYLNNEKLKALYDEWSNRLKQIKEVQIPKLSDMILDAEYSLSQMDYKSTMYKIAKLEMEMYKVRTNSDFLFGEIKDLTSSEERSRTIITTYKARYRALYQKFEESKSDYGKYEDIVNNQFEVIAKHFESFEYLMDQNEYTEVPKVLEIIDELLNHINIVVDEVPSIVLILTNVLPKRMEEAKSIYDQMIKEGYPLDYLNVEYNLSESDKKIKEIDSKTSKLDMNESLMELKVLVEYFDSLFNDFEKEKQAKKDYEEKVVIFNNKLNKMNHVVDEIFGQIDEIKNIYNLNIDDLETLNDVKNEVEEANNNFKLLKDHTTFNSTFAYSKLVKEIEGLSNNLSHSEEKFESTLNLIGSMHDDELRARQQLEEIKLVLKDSKSQMRNYKLPVIPESYYVELNEAQAAIREIVKELDKKPITIEVLNTRVDTARDLVLKLYNTTMEMIRTAQFAEMAMVYGNRYRAKFDEVDKGLNDAEKAFYKGNYKEALDLAIKITSVVDENIYRKLMSVYEK